MNRDEAIKMSVKFKGLMPRMTDEQVRTIRDELITVDDVGAAEKRIVNYCTTRAEFDLVSALNAVRGVVDFAQRTSNRMAEYREYEKQTAEKHRAEDELLDTLDPAELRELAESAISTLPERIATVERRRPNLSRLVKGMIFKTIQARNNERW